MRKEIPPLHYPQKSGYDYVRPFVNPSDSYSSSPSDAEGYTPAMLKRYYRYDYNFTGSGITIGIIEAFGSPTVVEDISVFSERFSLPDADITVNTTGTPPLSLSQTIADSWLLETTVDVQWAHAFAPDAKLRLYVANSDDLEGIAASSRIADSECDIVSVSFGKSEFAGEVQYESFFRDSNAFFICAAGDVSKVNYPASSAHVLCVGGSRLYLESDGTLIGEETVWPSTGCGISTYIEIPEYQRIFSDIPSLSDMRRAIPDVAFFAEGRTGAAIYHSSAAFGNAGWTHVSGTSVSAPCIAGIAACAAQKDRSILRRRNELFYTLAGRTEYTNPYRVFNDIVTGQSGIFSARVGFDLCSGLGSPDITNLIANISK